MTASALPRPRKLGDVSVAIGTDLDRSYNVTIVKDGGTQGVWD